MTTNPILPGLPRQQEAAKVNDCYLTLQKAVGCNKQRRMYFIVAKKFL